MPGTTTTSDHDVYIKVKTKAPPMKNNKPPVPYKPPGLSQKLLNNKTNSGPNIYVTASDTASLKSETSSVCRPLRLGAPGNDDPSDLQNNQINENKFNTVYNACEIQKEDTLGSRASRLGTLIQCKSDSTEEKTVCCANLAINLYNKALESAKRALPHKTKQRGPQFPRSFGEDFESLGPEGFNYLDDGQTECSYDYRDIEFNRDSMFRPDILAQTADIVLMDNSLDEPTNLKELQSRYGLPEEPERVQPYKPSPTVTIEDNSSAKRSNLKTDLQKSEVKTEVAINKDSESTADTSDLTTNTVEEGIIVKSRSISFENPINPIESTSMATPEPIPSTSSVATVEAETMPEPLNEYAIEVIEEPNGLNPEVINNSNLGQELSQSSIQSRSNRLSENMDLLAKRTSQLIIETAFESIAKSKAEEISQKTSTEKPTKKSSTESNAKDLKKEKKLLEKKLKEEEKSRKKLEKESKNVERKERKKLFDRFRSEDKQKRKIIKKQKEFEKIKRKMSEHKSKDSARSDAEADIEADDEYEPSDRLKQRTYEDIDDSEPKQVMSQKSKPHEQQVSEQTTEPPKSVDPLVEETVKIEFIENIREIGVPYVPSDDANEENVDENERKPKSKSFRIPRMESFKTKVIGIFPKKSPKTGDKIDKKPEEVVSEQKSDPNRSESTPVPEIVVDMSEDQKKTPEYENIDESNVVSKTSQSVPNNDLSLNQWETEDEDRLQFIERVSRVESPKKRKKSKTRVKLDRIKAKAMESLPKISSIMPKVKGLVGTSRKEEPTLYKDMDYERFISEHTSGRNRYDSDFDCVSDSELCDSLRRSGGLGRHHVYEEMAATQERLDAYMSPVSGPLRPPRRFSSLKNIPKVSSVPTLSTQVLLRPKRVPPPRPPPPRPPPPKAPVITITVNSSSREDSLKRRPKQRVPPEIYYNNLRMNFKPKRRFINLKQNQLEALATYDEPKPPLPVQSECLRPTVRAMRAQTLHRVNQKNALNKVLTENYALNSMPLKEKTDLIVNDPRVGPTPPPRRKRKAQRSNTIDPLDWKPFTWKTRRCRSMTELDVRKPKDLRQRKTQNYENIPPKESSRPRTPRPSRPPLPKSYHSSSISLHSSKRYISDNYHIYASIYRKGHPNVGRPLPPPPVPPRPKYILAKPLPKKRDVCISTKDNGLIEFCEKQTQIDARNLSICEDFNGNDLDLDSEKTPTGPLTPTTPINQTKVIFPKNIANINANRDLAEQCTGLNESTVTLSSISTSNWFDAENPSEIDVDPYKDYDPDTLNDDISSITSVYQSFSSDITVTQSREETPVPEEFDSSDLPVQKETALFKAVRSDSTRVVSESPNEFVLPISRRSIPLNVDDVTVEDIDKNFGINREFSSELKSFLDKRASNVSSERPDSIISSEASTQDIIMTNIESNSSIETCNKSFLWSSTQPISHSSSVDSLDSQPIDSSSDGDDYSLSAANQESDEFLKRKQQQKLFFIAKELYSSEEVFIDVLRLLNCDFRGAVEQHIPEETLNSILQLLPQLLQINEQLLTDLKTRIDDWPNHQRISDVLVKICPFLKQYSLYIRDFENISATYDDALRRYPAFAAAVKQFELTPRCQKLSVKHYMLKPVQRIPQYRLLLDDYLKHLNTDSEDYLDTCSALQIVSQVAEHANNSMKSNENISKLLSIQNSIIGGTEVIKPGRIFIKEGELMKLSRKGMQERCFILFNDCLMYLTAVQNGVFRVNHELSLTGMRVSLPTQQDFQNEFSVISHTRSFSLAARSHEEREQWVKALNKAIEENINKRISFAKSGSLYGDESEPTLKLGNCAPVWIPDARVTMCQLCTETFSVTFRRHHCRCCGKVVCSACSQNKAPLPYLKNRTARICDECFDKLAQQMTRLDRQSAQSTSASSGEVAASASDTDEGWNINEWRQQFARNLVRKSNRKHKHKYVPSVLKEVSANDVGSLISGYLHKREGKRNWKRFWFVIKDLVLYTYKASEDVAALKSLPLLGFKVETLRESVDGIDPKSLFQLSHPGQPTLMFKAETIGSAERWLKAMETATTLE